MNTAKLSEIRRQLMGAQDGQDVSRLRTGVVTAVNASGTVDVTLSGVTVASVPVLSGVIVLTGAVVQMLSYRGSLVVIGVTASSKQLIIKSADQNSATSSTAVADDTELFFTAAANATYLIDAYLSYGGAQAGDIRVAWTVPAGATMTRYILAPQAGMTDNANTAMMAIRRAATTQQIAGASGGTTNDFTDWQEKVILRTSTTAGTVHLQFGQGTSSGTVTVMRSDSFLEIRRAA